MLALSRLAALFRSRAAWVDASYRMIFA